MAFIYLMTDTWNNAGTTFDAIRMSVTDTTAAAASTLMNLIRNGNEAFTVRKDGLLQFNRTLGTPGVTTSAGITNGICSGSDQFEIAIYLNNLAHFAFRYDTKGFCSSSTDLHTWANTNNATQGTPDIGIGRNGANLLEVNTGTAGVLSNIVMFTARTLGVTFASLPTAASVSVGGRAMITNSNTATFNATAAGGGANVVPVFSDGTQWRVGQAHVMK